MAQRPLTLSTRPVSAHEAYGLGVVFVLAGAAHLLRLPLWLGALIGTIVIWRFYLARHGRHTPGKWLLGLIAIAATAGILIE